MPLIPSGRSAITDLDFIAFGVAFGRSKEVETAVFEQLSKWWKYGVQRLQNASALPLQLAKECRPALKEVALFEVGAAGAVFIESNLRDNYASLLSMVSKTLPDITFVAVRSCPVGRCTYPIEDYGVFRGGDRKYVRHVWAALDGDRWRFEQTGEIQNYECEENYLRRAIKDRLTREHIIGYLAALGVPLKMVASGEDARHIESFRERAAPMPRVLDAD